MLLTNGLAPPGISMASAIQDLLKTSLLVVCDRRDRFAINTAAPHDVRSDGLPVIDNIISALKEQNVAPYTQEKCFFADLALTMTRAWEAYSIDESGRTTCFQVSFELYLKN